MMKVHGQRRGSDRSTTRADDEDDKCRNGRAGESAAMVRATVDGKTTKRRRKGDVRVCMLR